MKARIVKNRVREIRSSLGITQEQLALLAGIARQSIISIERERYLPNVETALLISKSLKVPVDELFWLEE
ncbi:MAG TPA: helix-turn-helix transcriptional regulator [Anaerolineales bacterium]|nr:helix-turn-helix transcriptional regulator [Anaerolineales bacterium]